MKQSRSTSFLKSIVSTAVGFGVAMIANALVLPLFGFSPSIKENLLITCIYTVISIARGYVLERAFEAMGWRVRMSAFVLAALAELQRQRTHEGWTIEHDDSHDWRDLARAGAAYLVGPDRVTVTDYEADEDEVPLSGRIIWPWSLDWWKPRDPRNNLVRGCALALAGGERFDRQRKSSKRSIAVASEAEPRGA